MFSICDNEFMINGFWVSRRNWIISIFRLREEAEFDLYRVPPACWRKNATSLWYCMNKPYRGLFYIRWRHGWWRCCSRKKKRKKKMENGPALLKMRQIQCKTVVIARWSVFLSWSLFPFTFRITLWSIGHRLLQLMKPFLKKVHYRLIVLILIKTRNIGWPVLCINTVMLLRGLCVVAPHRT